MGILDELEIHKPLVKQIDEWLQERPKKEREEWLEALRRGDLYPCRSLQKLFAKYGLEVNHNAIFRYRAKMDGYVSKA